MKTYTSTEIAQYVQGTLVGDPEISIAGIEQLDLATRNQLTFISEKKYLKFWSASQAAAAFVNEDFEIEPGEGQALIRVKNANLAVAQALRLFEPAPPKCEPGVHSTAVVDPGAEIGEGVAIGAGCFIGAGVALGDNTRLYANVTILDNSRIGSHTIIWPGTVIRERCQIGSRCIIHPNVTIGSDGFGYLPSADGRSLVKIPQIGTVLIGDDVEIGSGTCIDRGKFSATSIGDGTKIDNLVQIAHNCRIGRSCVIAGLSGTAGSVTIGDGVMIGGGVNIKDHITIGAGARLGGRAGVISNVPPGQTVIGFPAGEHSSVMRQWAAVKKLPRLLKKLF